VQHTTGKKTQTTPDTGKKSNTGEKSDRPDNVRNETIMEVTMMKKTRITRMTKSIMMGS
jgi:hypothetical protein